MTEYENAMIDVETLGTDPDCVVLSIGIVFFNLNDEDNYETLEEENRSIYVELNPQEQINFGRSITFTTLTWWQEQNIQARAVFKPCETMAKRKVENEPILQLMLGFLSSHDCKNVCLWGNGSGFDNPIFNSLLKTYELNNPFRFWNDADLRTLKRLAGNPKLELVRGTYHNALDDAKYQVLAAQEYARTIVNEARE